MLTRHISTMLGHTARQTLQYSVGAAQHQAARRALSSAGVRDVVIAGGGIMGSSIAYHLRQRGVDKITVVERDPTYTKASTTLSVGSIRQQFSIRENVEMSMFSAGFIRDADHHLSLDDGMPVDVQFKESGYLFMATEAGLDTLIKNNQVQVALAAQVELLGPASLAERFPWLHTGDLAMGSLGLKNEGVFDPWALLQAFKNRNLHDGVKYVNAEVVDLSVGSAAVDTVTVAHRDGGATSKIPCGTFVNACGGWSAECSRMAGLGDLPVRQRRRNVFAFECRDGPEDTPAICVDPTGVYFRRESSGQYITGGGEGPERASHLLDEPPLEVEHDIFDDKIWPIIAHRVPAFEAIKVVGSWAGYYDYNTLDQNAILGLHPGLDNYYMATGFSGHGIQQGPAVGRAISELIVDGHYSTLDLRRFGYDRVLRDEPLKEINVV